MDDKTIAAEADKSDGHEFLRLLHLPWAIPAAILVAAPLWVGAQFAWCFGPRSCIGRSALNTLVTNGMGILSQLIAGLFAAGVIWAAPWTRKRKLKNRVAIGVIFLPTLAGVLLVFAPTLPL
jgi:hypothetical protein